MEEIEAPTPLTKMEEKKILEEEKFPIKNDEEAYILTCSKTNSDSILLNIKSDEEFIYFYYEFECDYKYLSNISMLFAAAKNADKAYKILIKNITNYQKDITLEFKGKRLKLRLKFRMPDDEVEKGFF